MVVPETQAYGIGYRTKKENTQTNNFKWTRRTTQKTGWTNVLVELLLIAYTMTD